MGEPVKVDECFIKQYSTDGRDPETRKRVQVFVATCETHGWRETRMTRHGRTAAVEAHQLRRAVKV